MNTFENKNTRKCSRFRKNFCIAIQELALRQVIQASRISTVPSWFKKKNPMHYIHKNHKSNALLNATGNYNTFDIHLYRILKVTHQTLKIWHITCSTWIWIIFLQLGRQDCKRYIRFTFEWNFINVAKTPSHETNSFRDLSSLKYHNHTITRIKWSPWHDMIHHNPYMMIFFLHYSKNKQESSIFIRAGATV